MERQRASALCELFVTYADAMITVPSRTITDFILRQAGVIRKISVLSHRVISPGVPAGANMPTAGFMS